MLGYYDEAEKREHIQRKSDQKKGGKDQENDKSLFMTLRYYTDSPFTIDVGVPDKLQTLFEKVLRHS